MDFSVDQIAGGRSVRTLSVVDDFNHEGLGMEAFFSLPAEFDVWSLNRLIEWRASRIHSGSTTGRYILAALLVGAEKCSVAISHIQPGKPQQNAYIERENRTVRQGWLGCFIFDVIKEV